MFRNKKAHSALSLILIILVSAAVGGILTYLWTIAYYVWTEYNIPENTTLTITNVTFSPKNLESFTVTVLNPSYSPSEATINGVAISEEGQETIYPVTKTDPDLEAGLLIGKGEEVTITCYTIKKGSRMVNWAEFAGKPVKVYVLTVPSPQGVVSGPYIITVPPYLRLGVKASINTEVSIEDINITVTNDPASVISFNITKIKIDVDEIPQENMDKSLPYKLNPGEDVTFHCKWNIIEHGLMEIAPTFTVETLEGYTATYTPPNPFPVLHLAVENLTFNEDHPDYFNVTVRNYSSHYLNVTKIEVQVENETATNEFSFPSVGIEPNSTETFKCSWNWLTSRDKNVTITVYTLQGVKSFAYTAVTPKPIILKIVGKTFSLYDKNHFQIRVLNHGSSIYAANLTKIMAENIVIVEINGTDANQTLPYTLNPGESVTLNCTWDWEGWAGENVTLTVYAEAFNQSAEKYEAKDWLILPSVELNVTSVSHGSLRSEEENATVTCLYVTLENLNYSAKSVTVLRIIVEFPANSSREAIVVEKNYIHPVNGTLTMEPGKQQMLLFECPWEEFSGEEIRVTVVTQEGFEASWQGTAW